MLEYSILISILNPEGMTDNRPGRQSRDKGSPQ